MLEKSGAGVARAVSGIGYRGAVCMEVFASGEPKVALEAFRAAFTV